MPRGHHWCFGDLAVVWFTVTAVDAVFPHLPLRRPEKCDIFSGTCLLSGEWGSRQVTVEGSE